MKQLFSSLFAVGCLFTGVFLSPIVQAESDADTPYTRAVADFKQASSTHQFFERAYGYALFPTVAKGGFGIGAAYGKGQVYKHHHYMGDTSLSQISIGFQIGGQAYSEIIFFKDAKAYDNFTNGSFEFNAQASAVAINIGANAQVGTTGNSASAGKTAAKAAYIGGMAVFTLAKGGLMFEAALAGQSFTYEQRSAQE